MCHIHWSAVGHGREIVFTEGQSTKIHLLKFGAMYVVITAYRIISNKSVNNFIFGCAD